MRKREMTEAQRARREAIVGKLTKAGWKPGVTNKMYQAGDFVQPEAEMTFSGKMELTVGYDAAEERLSLVMETSFGGPGTTLVMQCWSALDALLDAIVKMQKVVTDKNFRDHVVKIVSICPGTLADRNGKLVELDNDAPRKKD